MSVMRFVVLGAVGFGIGWAVAGFVNVALVGITEPMFRPPSPPPPGLGMLPYFTYFFAGAFGGAALGLALSSWKRAVALAASRWA